MEILKLAEHHNLGPRTVGDRKSHHSYPSIASRGLQMVGIERAEGGNRFVRHSPAFSQIIVTFEGKGMVNIHGQWRPCRKGEAFLTPANTPHAYFANPDKPWGFCFFLIKEPRVGRFLVPFDEATLTAVNPTPIVHALKGFLDEANRNSEAPTLELWMDVVVDCLRRIAHSTRSRVDYRLARAWSEVRQSLGNDWTLEDIAKIAKISKEQFRRLCHETYNYSPIKRLTILRMRHAADLLILSKDDLETIANKVGYTDPLAFRKAFCRIIGISPSKYRKQSLDHTLETSPDIAFAPISISA
ncbi:MAG: helix-turn-helix domain-containing protein [Verrucomicrobiota bacterium]